MLIYVAGIPGVGKTTVINNLVNQLNSNNHKSLSVRGLPILCKLAGNISPEEFRVLPDDIRKKYRPEMLRIIYKEDLDDFKTVRILDGHFAYYEAGSKNYSIRSINQEDYKQMKAIFVINSDPEKVLARRKQDDKTRADRTLDLEHIKEQEKIEIVEAMKQAQELKIPIYFISNDSDINKAVNEIYLELERLIFHKNEISGQITKEVKFR